jgi:hypothetical protein
MMKKKIESSRKTYRVVVEGKVTFQFYARPEELEEGRVYDTGGSGKYLVDGDKFIKIKEKNYDTHRNINQI